MAMLERIEDLADETYDPVVSDEVMFGSIEDPYSVLAELRARGPVVEGHYRDHVGLPLSLGEGDKPQYMVLSYEAVDQVLNDPVTFSSKGQEPIVGRGFGRTLTVMDPPEHTHYRKILQRAFRPSTITAWGDGIVAPVIKELVAVFRDSGRAELVEQFARPYPFNVIYRMLGLPPDDVAIFYKLALAQLHFYPDPRIGDDASAKLGRYFSRMIELRRAAPGDDIVSVVATVEVDGEYLPDKVVISFLRQLMNAGGDTTFRTTTALLLGLLTNPEQLDAVRQDRTLVSLAIEEALRWDGPVLSSLRETTAESVIQGVRVPAGAWLDVVYGSANHDPAVFEHPERFDLFRTRHRHFGFAFGAHNCLGQQLARLEMTRALNAVLDELPNVRLDPEHPTPHMYGALMRTPRQLHVVFDR